MINVLVKKVTKKKVIFKSTKKKGEDDGRGAVAKRRFCGPPGNVGDMEGTLDAWVLVASFSFSMITALVGIFQMIDRPYTAQGDFRCVYCFVVLVVFGFAPYSFSPPLAARRRRRVFRSLVSAQTHTKTHHQNNHHHQTHHLDNNNDTHQQPHQHQQQTKQNNNKTTPNPQ